MVSEVADFVISIGSDGRIVSQGSVDDAYRSNPRLKAEAEKDQELEHKGEQVVDESNPAGGKVQGPKAKTSDGKLMVAEEVAEGHVGWPALKLFLLALGGTGFWFMYLGGFVLSDVAILLETYWLGYVLPTTIVGDCADCWISVFGLEHMRQMRLIPDRLMCHSESLVGLLTWICAHFDSVILEYMVCFVLLA